MGQSGSQGIKLVRNFREGNVPETDLQQYVNADGRDALVRDVRRKIDELGINYIYYQFISVTGRIVV